MAGVSYEDWADHVIVWGLRGLGLRIVEELRELGQPVIVVHDGDDLRLARSVADWGVPHLTGKATLAETLVEAGVAGALAVICVEQTDLRNLEISFLAQELRPGLQVVTHIRNAAVGRALAEVPSPGTVLDVAALSAPSVAEACLPGRIHELGLGGLRFVVVETSAARTATLRELYAPDAVPLTAVTGGQVVLCPSWDQQVRAGDRVALAGSADALRARGVSMRDTTERAQHTPSSRMRARARWVSDEAGPGLRRALKSMAVLIVVSTLVLWAGYAEPGMNALDGLYFTVETIATVGFGDFSFADQPIWLRMYATALMVVGVTNTAVLFAYLTDLLVSRRLERSSGRRHAARMSDHIVIAGLGTVGVAAMYALRERGRKVVVIERDDESPFVEQARAIGVPIIFGDATTAATLTAAGSARAAAIAVLTSDDMVNIETALAIRDVLGERWGRVPVVPRIFDRTLARTLAGRFGFTHVRSTAELAAPWFVGAALGLEVLGTFTAEQQPLMAGRIIVTPGSDLDGRLLQDLPGKVRVLALDRGAGPEYPVRSDTRLRPGDGAYVIGPHAQLLRFLQPAALPE